MPWSLETIFQTKQMIGYPIAYGGEIELTVYVSGTESPEVDQDEDM